MTNNEKRNNYVVLKQWIILLHYIILIISNLTISSCAHNVNYTIKKNIPSPGGEFVAVLFLHNGGATTSYSPQVAILRKNEKLQYKKSNAKVFRGYRTKYIDAYWKDERTLVIQHNCLDEYIFKQLEEFQNIKIEYIIATREMIKKEDIDDFEYGDYFRRLY